MALFWLESDFKPCVLIDTKFSLLFSLQNISSWIMFGTNMLFFRSWLTVHPPVLPDKLSLWLTWFWLHWPLPSSQEVLNHLSLPRSTLLLKLKTSGLLLPGLRRLLKEMLELLCLTSTDSRFLFWRRKENWLLRNYKHPEILFHQQ
mgnify:CR=1 FL=1